MQFSDVGCIVSICLSLVAVAFCFYLYRRQATIDRNKIGGGKRGVVTFKDSVSEDIFEVPDGCIEDCLVEEKE